jgi:hypothetical protein
MKKFEQGATANLIELATSAASREPRIRIDIEVSGILIINLLHLNPFDAFNGFQLPRGDCNCRLWNWFKTPASSVRMLSAGGIRHTAMSVTTWQSDAVSSNESNLMASGANNLV